MPCAPRIVLELAQHPRGLGTGDALRAISRVGHVMIGDAEGQLGMGDAPAARRDLIESQERALVQQMPVDPEQRRAVLASAYRVRVPQLVDHGAAPIPRLLLGAASGAAIRRLTRACCIIL